MAQQMAASDLSSWTPAGQSKSIEYSLSVLTEIDINVSEGFNRFRRGGVEVGGVLFGTQEGERVTIVSFRPFVCEHALGPRFEFSENDRPAFEALVKCAEHDERLHGLIPVGWYHSHTRAGIHLSEQDLKIFETYFPDPWQVALVLRPECLTPTRAGFFFREADGSVHGESSYLEFSLPLITPGEETPPALEQTLIVCKTEIPASPPTIMPGFWPRTAEVALKGKLFFCAAPFLAVALIGAYFSFARRLPHSNNPLSLTVQDLGGQLRIGWNSAEPAVRETPTGLLEIREGSRTNGINLDNEQLRKGFVTYARTSEDVFVHMQAGTAEEWVAFMGPTHSAAATEKAGASEKLQASEKPQMKPEIEPSRFRQQADQIRRLEQMVEALKKAKKSVTARPFTPPSRSGRPGMTQPLEPLPIESFTAPVIPSNLFVSLSRTPIATPAVSRSARSGTLIWTGRITKKGTITIEGNRPSTGALTGEIPGFPVRVHAYPADLTSEGLTVYTAESKYPVGYFEPAGSRNGWNRTSYLHDAERARSIAVLEAPDSQNGWKRLVLRSDQPSLSIVVVSWDTL